MRVVDYTFEDPAENLAYEEVLLENCARWPETYPAGVLRFWESPAPFVVLGTSQKVAEVVHLDACRQAGTPVLRRCTAGGCVLQGPGSLNFTLVLPTAGRPELATIHKSYCHILQNLAATLTRYHAPVRFRGICDLALGDKKVSGNAQRRKRNAILHHGALLYRVDYGLMEALLQEPDDRPGYRGKRTHRDFVTALPLDAQVLRVAVCETFDAMAAPESPTAREREEVAALASEKYRTDAWNLRR